MNLCSIQCSIGYLNFNELSLIWKHLFRLRFFFIIEDYILTIRLASEFVVVFAEPNDLKTVNAAAKCLNASVSGPPPATANNCRNSNMEQCVLPEPDVPDKIIAWGYPVSACCRTVSWTIFLSCGAKGKERVDDSVNGLPTSWYGFTESRIGPTFVC